MNQIETTTPARPLTKAEITEFEALSARLNAADEMTAVTVVLGSGPDNARRCRVVVPATMTAEDLTRLKSLSAQQLALIGHDGAEAVATRLMAAFPAYRHGDAGMMFELLTGLLETSPIPAGRAMTDPTNPKSLIRTAKFAPSLAEVSDWIDAFMHGLLPSDIKISMFLKGIKDLEELQKLPDFKVLDA